MPRPGVVVVAAGEGSRLGLGIPKALAPLRGDTLLGLCLTPLRELEESVVVVVAPPGRVEQFLALAESSLAGTRHRVVAVEGGASRQISVAAGLAAVPSQEETDVILVHDAARATTPVSVFRAVIAHVRATGNGAVPALPVVDSLKRVGDDGRLSPVDRDGLYAVQTPQGFPSAAIRAAYLTVSEEHTDDAGVFSSAGGTVDLVDGSELAGKITFPEDLARAETDATERVGVGVDVHRFGEVGLAPMRLGGVDWPGEPALIGHSDGDVVIHAVCDALLAAAGLGDLGTHFGSARAEFAGADSSVFLSATLRLLADAGFVPVNVSVQLVGERPRVASRRREVQDHLTALLGAPLSFAATTTDGLGFLGHPAGLAAVATAIVARRAGAASAGVDSVTPDASPAVRAK